MSEVWKKTFTQTWRQIAHFEKNEVRAWKKASPLQKEARACERMKAYEKLSMELADKKYQEELLKLIPTYISCSILLGDKK